MRQRGGIQSHDHILIFCRANGKKALCNFSMFYTKAMCILCERGVREKLRVFFMATSHDVINPPPHPAADAHANKQAQCMNNEVQWLCWSKYYMSKFQVMFLKFQFHNVQKTTVKAFNHLNCIIVRC